MKAIFLVYNAKNYLPCTCSMNGVKRSVLVSMYMFVDKKNQTYFSDRFTFSNIRCRNSLLIYRLALPLCAPEMLPSSSKSRIFLYMVHVALFVRRITQLQQILLISLRLPFNVLHSVLVVDTKCMTAIYT